MRKHEKGRLGENERERKDRFPELCRSFPGGLLSVRIKVPIFWSLLCVRVSLEVEAFRVITILRTSVTQGL